MKRAQTRRSGRAYSDAGLYLGSATALLLALQPQADAQSQQRGASQQIRIIAHVKAFCRMGHHHGNFGMHGGLRIEGRGDDGRYIDRRLGGHGHFNVICNTPYALHLHHWGRHGWGGSHDDRGRGPHDLRVDNANDLNVLLHFASNTSLLSGPCVVAATTAAMAACLGAAEPPGETIFPPSRTLVRLAVVGQPVGLIRPVMQPLHEVLFYPEDGVIGVAGEAGAAAGPRALDDYIALSVSGRY